MATPVPPVIIKVLSDDLTPPPSESVVESSEGELTIEALKNRIWSLNQSRTAYMRVSKRKSKIIEALKKQVFHLLKELDAARQVPDTAQLGLYRDHAIRAQQTAQDAYNGLISANAKIQQLGIAAVMIAQHDQRRLELAAAEAVSTIGVANAKIAELQTNLSALEIKAQTAVRESETLAFQLNATCAEHGIEKIKYESRIRSMESTGIEYACQLEARAKEIRELKAQIAQTANVQTLQKQTEELAAAKKQILQLQQKDTTAQDLLRQYQGQNEFLKKQNLDLQQRLHEAQEQLRAEQHRTQYPQFVLWGGTLPSFT